MRNSFFPFFFFKSWFHHVCCFPFANTNGKIACYFIFLERMCCTLSSLVLWLYFLCIYLQTFCFWVIPPKGLEGFPLVTRLSTEPNHKMASALRSANSGHLLCCQDEEEHKNSQSIKSCEMSDIANAPRPGDWLSIWVRTKILWKILRRKKCWGKKG